MTHLPDCDFDAPLELRREMRPAPGYHAPAMHRPPRPPDWRPRGVVVFAREGEHPDKLIRRFARMVSNEGILADVRRHARADRPGQRRRLKRLRAAQRRRKAMR